MFSANENLQLRQHKRRIVNFVESCIPEDVLDAGTNVMVMQVACKAPGCVPLETAIIIVFPQATAPLLEGLPESQGGSYKTKVLKPMADVTKQDVLEALPPQFPGGLRTMEKLCLAARDVMLAQITQLTDDLESRQLVAQYLQNSLQEYMDRGCEAPDYGEPFGELPSTTPETKSGAAGLTTAPETSTAPAVAAAKSEPSNASAIAAMRTTGNIVLRRPIDDKDKDGGTSDSVLGTTTAKSHRPSNPSSVTSQRRQQQAERALNNNANILSRLYEREHAPGVRQPGCPCCDPDNPANVLDQMMNL